MQCILQAEASATGRSLVQGSLTDCVFPRVWSGGTINLYTYSEYTGRGKTTKKIILFNDEFSTASVI